MGYTVAVQRDLEEIGGILSETGYQVIPLEQCEVPVDAIVYSGVSCAWEGVPGMTNSLGEDPGHQVLLFNAVGMAPQEVGDLVRSRLG